MSLWNKCQKAASWLDKEKPEWYNKVDISLINMTHCSNCIHGQVFGRLSWHGNIPVKLQPAFYYESLVSLMPKGRESEFLKDILKEYWITLIKMRRN